jgi:hypothetical protein
LTLQIKLDKFWVHFQTSLQSQRKLLNSDFLILIFVSFICKTYIQ